MKKAVIYGRVSTQDQDADRQKTSMEDWAKRNGYEVVRDFAEKSSGRTKSYERKEFKNLLDFIKENDIKMILVDEVSRVGRLGGKTRMEIEDLADRGVNMFFQKTGKSTLKENGEVDYDTMLVIGIQADLAKREWDDTSYRIKNKLKESARSGKIQGALFKAYGFKGDENKNITVVDSELKVIKEIFKKFDNGLPTTAIAGWLNTEKIPTRYNEFIGSTFRGKSAESYTWSARTVYRILTNRMLVGERHHKKELVFNFEPVIDKQLFERVQYKLNNKINRPARAITNTNYLKGVVTCSCGMGMYMAIDKTKRVNSYICLSKRYAKEKKCEPCSYPAINIDKLMNSLFYVLIDNFIKNIKGKNLNKVLEDKIQLKSIELSNSEASLKKLKSKAVNLYDDYNERLITKQLYVSKKEELEKQIENESTNRERLKSDINLVQDQLNKPLKPFYTRELFLAEAKNIIKNVTIGRSSKKDEQHIKKTKQDIGISVEVQTITDQIFNYTLSKYSTNYLFEGKLNSLVNLNIVVPVSKLKFKQKTGRKFKGSKAI